MSRRSTDQRSPSKPWRTGVMAAPATCSEFTMFTMPQIDPGSYRLSIQIANGRQLSQYMTGLRLQNYQIESAYYAAFLGVKYTFFAISMNRPEPRLRSRPLSQPSRMAGRLIRSS